MSVIYPTVLDLADLAHEHRQSCVGWFVRHNRADGCALCSIGACIQLIAVGVDDETEVHGVLGSG